MFFFINEKQKLPDENFSLPQQFRGAALRLDGCWGVIAVAEVSAALQPQYFETLWPWNDGWAGWSQDGSPVCKGQLSYVTTVDFGR